MVRLSTLPTEILREIVKNIPGRPFKTELLLINKTLCSLLMAEQVRSLKLSANQINHWITLIMNNNVNKTCTFSVQQYCNLLDQVHELVYSFGEFGEYSTEAIAGFTSRCINLRNLLIRAPVKNSLQWDIGPFFDGLPFNIIQTHLYDIPIDNDERIQSFAGYLKRSAKLAILHLSGNNIGDKGVWILAEYLKQNSALTHLTLWGNGIGIEGVCVLAECLKQNSTLTHLEIGRNSIGDEGACILAESLKSNMMLVELDIGSNKIGNEGACALAEYLKQNSSLTKLEIGYNDIDDRGICIVAECLKLNSTLTQLGLCINGFGNEGASALAEYLKQNSSLTVLDIGYNYIGDEGARDLLDCLKQNSTLMLLNMEDNKLSYEVETLLKQNPRILTEQVI